MKARRSNYNPYAIATAQAKKMGLNGFNRGSTGRNKRNQIAEAIMRGKR